MQGHVLATSETEHVFDINAKDSTIDRIFLGQTKRLGHTSHWKIQPNTNIHNTT
jgi:hypothetical protein